MALSFPSPGSFREGFVVRFYPDESESWVGNFESGPDDFLTATFFHPNEHDVVIIAGGTAYIVDPGKRVARTISYDVRSIFNVTELKAVVLATDYAFTIAADDWGWQSPRISWGGFRNLSVAGTIISGECWSAPSEKWNTFQLNVSTGVYSGAAYQDDMAGAVKITPENAAEILGPIFELISRKTKPDPE